MRLQPGNERMAIQQQYQNISQTLIKVSRPPGVTILGLLSIFAGIGRVFSPFDRPFLAFGCIHQGMPAVFLRIGGMLLGVYIGVGLLLRFRHIWYLYPGVACVSILNLGLNMFHESKIWEISFLLQLNMAAIPRFVQLTHTTQSMLVIMYAFTAWYVYVHKEAFLGNTAL